LRVAFIVYQIWSEKSPVNELREPALKGKPVFGTVFPRATARPLLFKVVPELLNVQEVFPSTLLVTVEPPLTVPYWVKSKYELRVAAEATEALKASATRVSLVDELMRRDTDGRI